MPAGHVPRRVGVHVSRVALMVLVAFQTPSKTFANSIANYARDHPPAPDEAECTCTEDLLFDPDLDSQKRPG